MRVEQLLNKQQAEADRRWTIDLDALAARIVDYLDRKERERHPIGLCQNDACHVCKKQRERIRWVVRARCTGWGTEAIIGIKGRRKDAGLGIADT